MKRHPQHPITRSSKSLLFRGLVLLTSIHLLQSTLCAEDSGGSADRPLADPRAPLAAVIDFGSASLKRPGKTGRKFEQVGIDPHKVVTVTVQYPVDMAGQTIVAESLDGGRVIVQGPALLIDEQGLLRFGFQAGDLIGFSRLTLYNGETIQTLQFWVNDLSHPDQNPATRPGA